MGYPAILPDTGFGCWPLMPFAYADVPYLRDKEIAAHGQGALHH